MITRKMPIKARNEAEFVLKPLGLSSFIIIKNKNAVIDEGAKKRSTENPSSLQKVFQQYLHEDLTVFFCGCRRCCCRSCCCFLT